MKLCQLPNVNILRMSYKTKIPVYMDVPGLSDPVTPILCLSVHRWVPVAVVEDHGVSPRQVDPHPARPGAQNKRKIFAVVVEPNNQGN